MDKHGTFIAFEGGEGSGKDTHIERLKEKYKDRSDVVFTREPGGTALGEAIRTLLMAHSSKGMDVKTELLLFLAARAQLLHEVVRPALLSGKTVVTNRFGLSTIAYQIYGRERQDYLPFLQEITKFVVKDDAPDAYILLDVSPEVGLARARSRSEGTTRFDDENLAFHARVRNGYLSHIGEMKSSYVINADQSLEDVWTAVEKAFETILS